MKQVSNDLKKEIAVKDQKMEFLDTQCKDLRLQLDESYKTQENMVKAMKRESSPQTPVMHADSSENEELRQHLEDKETELFTLSKSLEEKVERISELELSQKYLNADHSKETEELRQVLQSMEEQREQMTLKLKSLEQQKLSILEEAEARKQEALSLLEQEMEDKQNEYQEEIK